MKVSGVTSKYVYKFGNPSFKIGCSTTVLIFSGWFPFPPLVAILLFKLTFMTSHLSLSRASVQGQSHKPATKIKKILQVLNIVYLSGCEHFCIFADYLDANFAQLLQINFTNIPFSFIWIIFSCFKY